MKTYARFLIACWVLSFLACSGSGEREFWIYTSTYKEVYPLFEPGLQKAFPGVAFRWHQSGSEKIAAKILAEQTGGKIRADLIMTSDLFFYQELKEQGLLIEHTSPALERVDPAYRDPAFVVNRFPVMVLAYNNRILEPSEIPAGFQDLLDPKYRGKLTMPSPLESGSALTSVLYLFHDFGEEFFKGLRRNDILAAGGNGATLSRIQSGERPVGMVLMENVLKARESGMTAVDFVIPREGALPIPSPVAILKGGRDEDLARAVMDWFLSDEAQKVIVKGWVHSVFPDEPPPNHAPDWSSLNLHDWDLATFEGWSGKRQAVKSLFRKIVLE